MFFGGRVHCHNLVHWVFSFLLQVGKDNVHTALSLVGYEADLRKAMEYVFGSTLVCDTLDNAKKVAFDRQVMTKTVTLGGDIFDPQGTLSGGENSNALLRHSQFAVSCSFTYVVAVKWSLSLATWDLTSTLHLQS